MNVVSAGPQDGWIGTRPDGLAEGRQLYRFQAGGWRPLQDFPSKARRADVMTLDASGNPWVCTFSPNPDPEAEAAARAKDPTLHHFDGTRWHSTPISPPIWVTGIAVVSPEEVWLIGHYGELAHYQAGTWRKLTIRPEVNARYTLYLTDIEMKDPHSGWAVGWSGVVLHYDQGEWRQSKIPESMSDSKFWGLSLGPDGNPWIVEENGRILHRAPSGWRIFETPARGVLYDIAMTAGQEGWAVGENTLLHFDGRDWRTNPLPVADTNVVLQHIAMSSPSEGWIVGDGLILKANPGDPTPLRPITANGMFPMLLRGGQMTASADMDGDGDMDLLTFSDSVFRLYRNEGPDAGFLETPLFPGHATQLDAFTLGDQNGDALPDLIVHDRVSGELILLLNPGNGVFLTPSHKAGPVDEQISLNLVDIDLNGTLDVYAGVGNTRQSPDHYNQWLQNDGAARYQQSALATHFDFTPNVLWGDLNGDGTPDMVLGNGEKLDIHLNDGQGGFRIAPGPPISLVGYQNLLVDMDVDGDLDLLVGEDQLTLYLNDGHARFTPTQPFGAVPNQPSAETEWSGIANTADLDHDGFPDLLIQTTNQGKSSLKLFLYQQDGTYQERELLAAGSHKPLQAATFTDWDDDGDLDLFAVGGGQSLLFENTHNKSDFLKIKLQGERDNPMAFGATVSLYTAGRLGDPKALLGHQQLGMGQPQWGLQSLSELHFGLPAGQNCDVLVTFPGGRTATQKAVHPGQTLTISAYQGPARRLVPAWYAARRAILRADKPLEFGKALLALLFLFVLRRPAAVWAGARHIVAKPLFFLLFPIYLLSVLLQPQRDGTGHLLHLIGFIATAIALLILDHYYSRWRANHYLGHFRLLAPLGQGGMGKVFRARNVISRQTVALKTLHPEIIEEESGKLRFLREAAILGQLNHPNIVAVKESGEASGRGYISMELLQGSDLKRLLHRQGPLASDSAITIMAQVLEALRYIHGQGVLHRDLKSENIFVLERKGRSSGRSSGEPFVKLLDFGLSRDGNMRTMTRVRELAGTLAYMAPERLRGERGDRRADIYAAGVVLYEMLTGKFPFEAENDLILMEKIRHGEITPLQNHLPGLSPTLAAWVAKAMATEPEARHQSADEMYMALLQLGTSFPQVDGPALGVPATAIQPSHPGFIHETVPSAIYSSEAWLGHFREVKQLAGEGHLEEARTLLPICMESLQSLVDQMTQADWETYCRRYDMAELQRWLEWAAAPVSTPIPSADPKTETHSNLNRSDHLNLSADHLNIGQGD